MKERTRVRERERERERDKEGSASKRCLDGPDGPDGCNNYVIIRLCILGIPLSRFIVPAMACSRRLIAGQIVPPDSSNSGFPSCSPMRCR